SGTNQIQFLGTVQIQGSGTTSFQQSQFASSVQIQCTGTVSFSQSQFQSPVTAQAANVLLSQVSSLASFTVDLSIGTGTNLQAYDCSFGPNNAYSLNATAGKVLLKRCSLYGLSLSNNTA